eukprot:IDg22886t1
MTTGNGAANLPPDAGVEDLLGVEAPAVSMKEAVTKLARRFSKPPKKKSKRTEQRKLLGLNVNYLLRFGLQVRSRDANSGAITSASSPPAAAPSQMERVRSRRRAGEEGILRLFGR